MSFSHERTKKRMQIAEENFLRPRTPDDRPIMCINVLSSDPRELDTITVQIEVSGPNQEDSEVFSLKSFDKRVFNVK